MNPSANVISAKNNAALILVKKSALIALFQRIFRQFSDAIRTVIFIVYDKNVACFLIDGQYSAAAAVAL